MNKIQFILLFILLGGQVYSQQWVAKQYQYDSLINIYYGSSINFMGGIDSLYMDIYIPKCEQTTENKTRPLLMWIHGGAFLAGDKNDPGIQSLCKSFARRGYVTASISYRLGYISDDERWVCNYPNYGCVFASDSAEWVRAYYRAVQDAKGALRYLVNRHESYGIDTSNIFIAGESAGAFTALGVGLLDMDIERPLQTYSINSVDLPHPSTYGPTGCLYNRNKSFTGNKIARYDLGVIDGSIEPTKVKFTIKGIGNMYGAMLSNLLKEIPSGNVKPAIYSFHQPCDLVVPIDSNFVNWGLSWCFTNGYNCHGITNNQIMLYGSRVFSTWNTKNSHGYTIQNEFTSTGFAFSFLFGEKSCFDQIANPCHAYDNRNLREINLANFFAKYVMSDTLCNNLSSENSDLMVSEKIELYPNPTSGIINIKTFNANKIDYGTIQVFDQLGIPMITSVNKSSIISTLDLSPLPDGIYLIKYQGLYGKVKNFRIVKISN